MTRPRVLVSLEAVRIDHRIGGRGEVQDSGSERRSRTPWDLAWLIRIEKIHVLSADRSPNRSIPVTTANHVSWTTSSATASEAT